MLKKIIKQTKNRKNRKEVGRFSVLGNRKGESMFSVLGNRKGVSRFSVLGNRKGVSMMISYVLLISISIMIAAGVFTWLKYSTNLEQLPECKVGTSLILESYFCDGDSINLTIKNDGYFNVSGYTLLVGDMVGRLPIETLPASEGEEQTHDFGQGNLLFKSPLGPSQKESNDFDMTAYAKDIRMIQIQSFILSEQGDKIPCEGGMALQEVDCGFGNGGVPAGCTSDETPESTCNDGKDNDCDEAIDCDDGDCVSDPVCIPIVNFRAKDTNYWTLEDIAYSEGCGNELTSYNWVSPYHEEGPGGSCHDFYGDPILEIPGDIKYGYSEDSPHLYLSESYPNYLIICETYDISSKTQAFYAPGSSTISIVSTPDPLYFGKEAYC